MSDTITTIENNETETVEEEQLKPSQSVLSDNQEQVLQTIVEPEVVPYSDEEIAALKAKGEDEENLDPEEFTVGLMNDVRSGKLSKDQFAELMGMSYEDCLTELGETSKEDDLPGIGHNNPPADTEAEKKEPPSNINPTNENVQQELRLFKPTVENAAEAEKEVKEALLATVEHISSGETSLASKGAIAIANWTAFNAGLRNDGNKLIAVNIGMYDKILASISGMVDADDAKDPTFKATVGQMIKRAILIMDGKLSIGYFVLPGDRKRVKQSDDALLEYPNDVPEGSRVVRSTVISDARLRPMIPHIDNVTKAKIGEVDNQTSTAFRLINNETVDILWRSLWDRDGEIQYSPLTGAILAFKTGQQLRDEETRAKAQLEKEKAEANKEPAKRQTQGTQTEGEGNSLEEQNTLLKRRVEQAQQDVAAAVEANKGDILNALNGLGAYIRDTSQPMPEQARTTFWKDANAMFARRLIGPNVTPNHDEMRELCRLAHNLDNHVKWNDKKATWEFIDVDGLVLATFEPEIPHKAA